MRKILTIVLTGLLAFAGAATAAACTVGPVEENLYFVPGTYISGGEKVENEITSGATKLSEEACAEMNTENVYRCALSAGENLPVPSSGRTDKEGNPYTFNGWWAIVNATVTYYDKVPSVTETTFLYADWRADLSQRRDPVIPDGSVEVEPDHYMTVKHKESGETDKVTLRKQYTNVNSETLGYLRPVELCVQGLQLIPGDELIIYTTGLDDSDKAVESPVEDANGNRYIELESNADKTNVTADYIKAPDSPFTWRTDAVLTYIAEESGYFNIYIKYFSGGSKMAVYLEPAA